jgi:alkanesulfonate monooxygenase SsuD/methylene tetrahydromethanopterin reductase-like flavin-dependent oxidoreductase (luciferase family)
MSEVDPAGLRLHVMLEPQEALSYEGLLAVAQRAEQLGFDGLSRSDHYKSVVGADHLGSTDAWATLAGLARETRRLQLGTMVSPATFRPAANLAKVVATVTEMVGVAEDGTARVELGMGTGWLESEHRQHGFPFEELDTRFRRLEEHLAVITGLWDAGEQPFTFTGEFEQLEEARFVPAPVPRPKLIVGGAGPRRTPRLVARYADELNTIFSGPEQCAEMRSALDRACQEEGRDPSTVGFSLMTGCLVGTDAEEVRWRAGRLQDVSGDTRSVDEYVADLSQAWVVGTPEQARQRLNDLADSGVQRVLLQHQLPDDLAMLDVVAQQIRPELPRGG